MRTGSRSHTNHREMPHCSIWRPLWSIQNSSQNLAKWFFLANDVWGHQRIHSKVSKMPDAWWHNNSQCNAPHKQSPSLTIRRLGHWLHGTIPEVTGLRVHTGGSGIRIQVGGSITMQSCRCQTCPEDVPWNHLPSVWNSKNGHKWRRVTLHWQDLPKLPQGVRSQAQHCHSIPPTNQRLSRDIQQTNQKYPTEDRQQDGEGMEK